MHTTDGAAHAPMVHLLGPPSDLCRPFVSIGAARFAVPRGSERLLALVALSPQRRLARRQVTGTLWPDHDVWRGHGSLRSALGRLRGAGIEVLRCEERWVGLRADVAVDVQLLRDGAELFGAAISDGDDPPPPPLPGPGAGVEVVELLPGWDEDWVRLERRRLRRTGALGAPPWWDSPAPMEVVTTTPPGRGLALVAHHDGDVDGGPGLGPGGGPGPAGKVPPGRARTAAHRAPSPTSVQAPG